MIGETGEYLKKKTRWYDIIDIESTSTSISFKNSRIYSANEKQNRGVGIRVNADGRTGFSFTSNTGNLTGTADRALALATYGDHEDFSLPGTAPVSIEPYRESIEEFNTESEIHGGSEIISLIVSRYPGISVDMSIHRSSGTVRLLNSEGLDSRYRNSYFSASLSTTYINGKGVKIDIWESLSSLEPVPYRELADRILQKIEYSLEVRKTPSGRVPVLFTPKAGARLMGIITSGLNGRSVWKGISPFADKIGEQVFNSAVNLANNPLDNESPYSYPFDDEGTPSHKATLINEGVITGFVTDLKHAFRLNTEPGGNASRGYSTLPSPSFSNIEIAEGSDSFDAMISGIEKGILVDQFIGLGQSNTLTGDFSANLDLAFMIEKGKITGRVKDCMITDNLFDLLSGECVISSDREKSGAIYMPYILIPSVNFTA